MDPIVLENGKKFKNVTVNLGAKVKGGGVVEDGAVVFENDVAGQVVWERKNNDIIITAYDAPGGVVNVKKVLGKVTIKNVATKNIVEQIGGEYVASIAGDHTDAFNFITGAYELDYSGAKKAQKITGTYLNENIIGSDYDDTIKAVGGNDSITGGKGADKMYAGEGDDVFYINNGDALLDAKGKGGDIIYGSDGDDRLYYAPIGEQRKFTKENDNLIIEDTHDGGTDKVTIDKYFVDSLDFYGINLDVETINITGNAKKANALIGTDYNDSITGGVKDDYILSGAGNDTIDGGLGDDDIYINDVGKKTVYMHKNEGADGLYVGKDFGYDEETDEINVQFDAAGEGEEVNYSYEKSLTSLIVYVEHTKDGVTQTESMEIVDFFNASTGMPDVEGETATAVGNVKINGEKLADILQGGSELSPQSITVAGVPVSDILDSLGYSPLIKAMGINVPSGFKNGNVYLGSGYNDMMTGSSNKDAMISFGGINEFTTGTKGQTLIASLGIDAPQIVNTQLVHTAYDTYNVEAFEAGTFVYDVDGQYDMTIKGVNTDDIHLAGRGFAVNPLSVIGLDDKIPLANINYLTDSKGMTNLEGIDYKGIYNKVMTEVDKYQETGNFVPLVNYGLNTASTIVDKFRGVAIASGAAPRERDLKIVDKEGIEQTVTAMSQALVMDATQDYVMDSMWRIEDKYLVPVADLTDLGKLLVNPTSEDFWVSGEDILDRYGEPKSATDPTLVVPSSIMKYYKVAEKGESMEDTMYSLSDTAYKEIKGNLFNIYKNSYVGTSGDNTFTINKSEYGAAIASGTGSDKFVFNGDITGSWGTHYQIASTYDGNSKDTIEFKNYSFEENTLSTSWLDIDNEGETVTLNGINLEAFNPKTESMAGIGYYFSEDGDGIDITNHKFDALTIKDSKREYAFSAEHSDGAIQYNWNEDGNIESAKNHYAVVYGNDIAITSNDENNIIESYGAGEFEYTYANGHDTVSSSWVNSDDTYKATLTMTGKNADDFKADLTIEDWDQSLNDKLLISNEDVSNLRLYFNIDSDGWFDGQMSLMSKVALAKGKSSFNITSDEWGASVTAKNGINFNFNEDGETEGIDFVGYGENEDEIDVNAIIGKVKESLAGWFDGKDYADVNEVLANGKASEIKELIGYYDAAYNEVMNELA